MNRSAQFWRQNEKQIPSSSISKATWSCSSRRMVQNSARDCSKLVRVHSKKKVAHHHINKEMCLESLAFPLICPTPLFLVSVALCKKNGASERIVPQPTPNLTFTFCVFRLYSGTDLFHKHPQAIAVLVHFTAPVEGSLVRERTRITWLFASLLE
jgi:hypothetical protein